MNSQVNILQGIMEKQFIPYIQPVVDAETERLIGGEAVSYTHLTLPTKA